MKKSELKKLIKEVINDEKSNVSVKSLKQLLINFGFKLEETETTAGAYKLWMKIEDQINWKKLLTFIKQTYPTAFLYKDPDFNDIYIVSSDFKIQSRGNNNIFVSITKRRPKGNEYKLGIDI